MSPIHCQDLNAPQEADNRTSESVVSPASNSSVNGTVVLGSSPQSPDPEKSSWGWLWIPVAIILVIVCVAFIFVILCYRTDKDKDQVQGVRSQGSPRDEPSETKSEDKFPITSKTEHRNSYDYKFDLKTEFGGKSSPTSSKSDEKTIDSGNRLVHLTEPKTDSNTDSKTESHGSAEKLSQNASKIPSKLATSKIRSSLSSKVDAQKSGSKNRTSSAETLKKASNKSQVKSTEGKPKSKENA